MQKGFHDSSVIRGRAQIWAIVRVYQGAVLWQLRKLGVTLASLARILTVDRDVHVSCI